MHQRHIIITADGSQTIEIPTLQVTYHSHHGAIQESKHVFIEAGLRALLSTEKQKIRILEIGFGTGLNALITLAEAASNNQQISYTTLEMYPVESKEFESLEYTDVIGFQAAFIKMHQSPWEEKIQVTPTFELLKLKSDIEHFEQPDAFDLIYFDAFSPVTQPELWTASVMTHMYNSLSDNGILTTYCAKGIVKRTLKAVGFSIESLPGPPGKREMTRATKRKN